jgi:two-component system OmpR family response regulator
VEPEPPPSGHTILVVDDDASIRFLCRVNLELEGWTVREAATIDDARDELAGDPVSLVLLDVHIGTASGADFLGELRRQRPGLAVAMLTGTADGAAFEELGADAVIAKPFTLDELTQTVRSLVSTGR